MSRSTSTDSDSKVINNDYEQSSLVSCQEGDDDDEEEIDLNDYDDNDDDGIRRIYLRIKLGMIEINDVDQQYRPDVDIFFYYEATEEDKRQMGYSNKNTTNKKKNRGRYFHNAMKKDGEWPFWTPHFDFNSEVEEALITDESYWIMSNSDADADADADADDTTVFLFGRINMVPKLQNRINHTAFPYDRQILHVELLSNNCCFEHWNRDNDCPRELKLFYDQWHIQGELNSLADTWDLHCVRINIERSDSNNQINAYASLSSKANLFMYIQREPEYYTYNISLMLFFIVSLQNWIINFPFDESRFEFALNLVLTQIAFRFVISAIVPRTSYLMYLDKYMQIGFVLLVLRFIIDWGLILAFPIPSVAAGDDFRCGWSVADGKLFDLRSMPSICVGDFYTTLVLFGFWTLGSIFFLFPQNWRRGWSTVEDAVEEDKLLENTFYEKRRIEDNNTATDNQFCRRQLWSNRDQSIGRWLKENNTETKKKRKIPTLGFKESIKSTLYNNNCTTSIEKPFDIIECRDMFFEKKKKSFFSFKSNKKEGGIGRGCKELRGWTEPTTITTTTATATATATAARLPQNKTKKQKTKKKHARKPVEILA